MVDEAQPADVEVQAPSDGELLAAHVAGDQEAFAEIVRRHRDRLYAVALRTLGDPEDAADAVQNALVSAYRSAASYRGDAAVTTWLHRVVVNACLDLVRRRRTRQGEPLPDDDSLHPADPGDAIGDRLTALEVQRALLQLPVEQRTALVLVDVQGYSVLEAAAILDCAPGTVKSRCSRGRARLLPLLSHLRNPTSASHVPPEQPQPPGPGGPEPTAQGGQHR